jgi:Dolichyl-phosphate-mannose-protein mannosyltransferase
MWKLAHQQPLVTHFPEQRKADSISPGPQRLRDRFETGGFTRHDSVIALAIILLLYLAVISGAVSRHLWFDELFTYWIAQAPSISKLLKQVRIDLHPPLEYLLVRGSLAVFGDSEFATRFPSIVAFLIGSLCLYRFVYKRLSWTYGMLALLVFWSTPLLPYATEARPYALIVAFFGIGMLAWQRAIAPARSKSSIVVLALAVLGMMFSHFFSLFYTWPFCVAELWRSYRSRKFDWAIWIALVLPTSVLLYYLRQLRSYQSMALPPVQQASPFKIFAFFYHTLEPEGVLLLLAVCIGLAAAFRRERQTVQTAALMTSVEAAFTAGLLTIPVVLGIGVIGIHGAFFPRYGILAAFGYALAMTFFVAIYANLSRLAAVVACCILALGIAGNTAISATLDALRTWGRKTAAPVQQPPIERVRPDLPLVAASGVTFFEMNKYESPSTLARLHYLHDRDLAIRYAHATIFEGPFLKLNRYFPLRGHFDPYRRFVAEHPHFLVLGTPDYPEDWLLPRLLDIHARLNYLGNFATPYDDKEIFEVSMPGSE